MRMSWTVTATLLSSGRVREDTLRLWWCCYMLEPRGIFKTTVEGAASTGQLLVVMLPSAPLYFTRDCRLIVRILEGELYSTIILLHILTQTQNTRFNLKLRHALKHAPVNIKVHMVYFCINLNLYLTPPSPVALHSTVQHMEGLLSVSLFSWRKAGPLSTCRTTKASPLCTGHAQQVPWMSFNCF